MPNPVAAARRHVRTFDSRVDTAFDALRGRPAVDRVFYAASELGDFSLVWLLLGGVRALRSDRDLEAAKRLAVGLAAEYFAVNALIKSVFRRRRPPWEADRPLHVRQPRTSSFPSGHATAACVATILLSEDDPLWPLYCAVGVVVASSRVYVKIHHASDVLAGVVVGVALGVVGRRLMPLPPPPDGGDDGPKLS
ncbi:MAG TPA: phosphatase PAP2 family protein [Acidimicrobiales bacterium]|nr:phosphatase PAP2 family protein [Acidimicrobiales bacterium]